MNGWWKFHRKMDKHAVWSLSDAQFKVWISILNLANHQDQDWWNGTERVEIKAGSFITSLSHLAQYSHTTIKTIRIALGNLSKIGSIRAEIRANRYTLITLVNAETYRGTDVEEGTVQGKVGARQGHSEGTAGALTGEGENEKKERKKQPPSPRALPESVEWGSSYCLILKYNKEAPDNVPSVRSLSEARVTRERQFLRMFPDEQWWTVTFRQYHLSRFLSGRSDNGNGHKAFQPDFDWLLSKGKDGIENCVKVHDGRYRDG